MPAPQTEVVITIAGKEHGRHVLTPGDYIVGRNSDCPIRVDADLVSREHAKLILNYDHALIEDLGSSNGTQVNGQPVPKDERTRLWPNQKIQIGTATIELRRLQSDAPSDMSLAPAQRAVRDMLPAELLREKKYDIGAVVARGGMGAILDAKEAAIKRRVAMKVMLDTNDAEAIARFVAEAQVTGQLEHPNIVPIYELGVDENGQVYYTMKMVRGITLKKVLELLAKGVAETVQKFPLSALLTVFQKVCDAIAFAHSKGVIHRDLKPENIMLGDFGSVLVMDWGLAKVLDPNRAAASVAPGQDLRSIVHTAPGDAHTGSMTLMGTIMGTPQYMAPEQARGEIETLDARTDIYALGAILFHVLFLRAPVSGGDAMQVVGKVARGEVEWPAAKELRAVPDSLLAVCRKALAFAPDARYARTEALQADILAYQNGFATSAEKAGLGKLILLAIKRHKAASIGIAAVLLVGSVLGTKVLVEGRKAERALTALKNNAPVFAAEANRLVLDLKFEEAFAKLDVAIALQPDNADYRLTRAHLLQGSERLPEAIETYQRVLRLRSGDASAKENLDLCQRVLALSGGQMPLNRAAQAALYDAVKKQGRGIDATPLARVLGKDGEAAEKLLRERLAPLTKGPHWKDCIARAANGTFQVNLTNIPFPDLSPLKGMPIAVLKISGCGTADLRPLDGMPLRSFIASGQQLKDLSPLKGAPLNSVTLHETTVTDLSALANAPLEQFTYSRNSGPTPTVDLSPLRGKPLRIVNLNASQVADFSVVASWSQLEEITLSFTAFSDLRLLSGKPIKKLMLESAARVSDLSPLRGMPIEELLLAGAKMVTDYTPLLDLPKLTRLRVDALAPLPPGLLQHPTLKEIGFGTDEYLPAAQVLSEYERVAPIVEAVRKAVLAGGGKALPGNAVTPIGDGLVRVDLRGSGITDLTGLRGLPIARLSLEQTPVQNLSPLRDLPLVKLDVRGTRVSDISPLIDCPKLTDLILSPGINNIEVLRQHPTLRYMGYGYDPANQRADKTVKEFWAEYDAQQAAQKK